MKLAKILSILKTEPLLCSDDYRTILLDLFAQHADLTKVEFVAGRTGIAKSGQELDVEQAETQDGICFIPVGGPIGTDLGEFEKGAGAVDTDDIRAEIEAADEDNEVETIVLMFDSPGGMVVGTPELSQVIADTEKPIYAFTRGKMASAAYWLACSCDGIFATQSAIVGNIGVCMAVPDLSRAADMQGVRVKVFASGPYKGLGTPGTSLTMAQESFLQNRVMQLAESFYSHVRDNRAQIEDSDMQGQFYSGDEAVEKGFVDSIVKDRKGLISLLT